MQYPFWVEYNGIMEKVESGIQKVEIENQKSEIEIQKSEIQRSHTWANFFSAWILAGPRATR